MKTVQISVYLFIDAIVLYLVKKKTNQRVYIFRIGIDDATKIQKRRHSESSCRNKLIYPCEILFPLPNKIHFKTHTPLSSVLRYNRICFGNLDQNKKANLI